MFIIKIGRDVMKKIIIFVFLMFVTLTKVEALGVEKNELTIKSGESSSVSLSANVGEIEVNSIEFTLIYMSNDVPGNFIGANDSIEGTKHRISFSEPMTGTISLGNVSINVVNNPTTKSGEIKIHSATAATVEGALIPLNSQTITVTIDNSANKVVQEENINNENTDNNVTVDKKDESPVTTTDNKNEVTEEEPEEVEENSNLLESIDSKIVNIKLKNNKFEYTIKIDENIEELDLKPILKDDSYQVEISTQKIAELEDNKIIITVSKEDIKEVYTINVKIAEEIEIDNEQFVSSNSHKVKWIIIIVALSAVLIIGLTFMKKK